MQQWGGAEAGGAAGDTAGPEEDHGSDVQTTAAAAREQHGDGQKGLLEKLCPPETFRLHSLPFI